MTLRLNLSRLLFILTSVRTDLFLQPVESPPAGQSEECKFKALPHWLHLSELEVAVWSNTVIIQ